MRCRLWISAVFLLVAACGNITQNSNNGTLIESHPSGANSPSAPETIARYGERGPIQHAEREPVFPKSPMPQHLVVVDGQSLTTPMRLLLVSLQGILAKTEPRLYFNPSTLPNYDSIHEEEGLWLTEMENKWSVTAENMSDPWAVLDRFVDEVQGYIIYDPDMPQTINVATTMAGIHQALIADPDLAGDLAARGLTLVDDLRGRFTDNVDLYTWAFQELWPQSNQSIIAFLASDLMPLRDYLIAHNILTMQLDPHHWAERPLLDTILSSTPQNIPVLGWPLDELLGVIIFSQHGKFLVVTDMVSNLTAHSGLTCQTLTQNHITEWPNIENKIYVSFAFTDGDSMSYLNRWMAYWWEDPAFDQIPLGWEMSMAPVDLAPDVIGYFYDRLTENNVIIGPASGIGYVYPNQYPDMDTFLELTHTYLGLAGMRTLWIINDDLTLPDDLANRYGLELELLGIYIDYWPTADKCWYLTSAGVPVLRSRYTYLVGPEQISNILSDAAIEKEFLYPDFPTFVFIGVNAWVTSPSIIKSYVDQLDDRYIVIRPDAMFAAMRTAGEQGLIP